jgi:tRNA threonylcarbamoyladenosine biosynthesis protein TsaE
MSRDLFTFDARSEADTARLGHALAACLSDGCVVALDGALGVGKTRLVQAVAEASGVDRAEVVSPTFVLVHEYFGRRPMIHIDAYRLAGDDEFVQLGISESFGPPNLVFIEWAERVARCLPDDRLEIAIEILADEGRRFKIRAIGPGNLPVIACLQSALS